MKKTIFGVVAAVAVCALVGFNVALNTKTDKLSDIALASIEAIANNESGDGKEEGKLTTVITERRCLLSSGDLGWVTECIPGDAKYCLEGCIASE